MASLLITFFLILTVDLQAKDFGCYGKTFPILEQDLLEYLRERLLNSKPDEQQALTNELIRMAREPKPIPLPNALTYRSFIYDPTITAHLDVTDTTGNIIVKKGTTYNPLNQYNLPENLLFFDATQKVQIDWAKETTGCWILLKGNPIELENKEGRPIYFDQNGFLISKLGIKAIPAKVSQNGKVLKIEEIALEDI